MRVFIAVRHEPIGRVQATMGLTEHVNYVQAARLAQDGSPVFPEGRKVTFMRVTNAATVTFRADDAIMGQHSGTVYTSARVPQAKEADPSLGQPLGCESPVRLRRA